MNDEAELPFAAVARLCARHGLTPCGVVAARRDPAVERSYREWLAAGRHGAMAYLERHAPLKADPEALLPGCRTVLVVALGYYQTPGRRWTGAPAGPHVAPGGRTEAARRRGSARGRTAVAAAEAAGFAPAAPGRPPPGVGDGERLGDAGSASAADGGTAEAAGAAAAARSRPPPATGDGEHPGDAGGATALEAGAAAGRIAQYAWGRDYHKLLRARLRALARELTEQFPAGAFRVGVDATPLLETHYAVAAGIGFRGKHTLAINAAHGSWFFIGELLTTLVIGESPKPAPKRCGSGCTYCIDVCPTRAIVAPYQLDARRCISYLTIEHRGPVPEELRPAVGDWLFGCDLCQEVCPWTVRAQATPEPDLLTWRAGSAQALAPLLALRSHADLTARFAGSPLMRAGRDRLVRNACTVAGNRRARELLPQLRRLTGDPDRGVAEHARWAVAQITAVDPTC